MLNSAATISATAPLRTLSVLVAPLGQLSEDGQLRELIDERRQRRFGGCTGTLAIPLTWLQERAMGVPAPAPSPLSNTNSTTTDRASTL